IHMNKFKHVTPTNIAPLGKRHNNLANLIKKKNKLKKVAPVSSATEHHQQTPQPFQLHHQIQSQSIPSTGLNTITHTISSQNHQQHSQQHSHQQPNIGQQLWTCELCNRILPTREEWTAHAKAHMEVRKRKNERQEILVTDLQVISDLIYGSLNL
ncbi:uncharacterized protein, partial [Chironomus tepperi]|uniref:uncharacterized protein n=1 Tax=Chironomus tepperi TaxID=113505 RepID=UPI00391F666E